MRNILVVGSINMDLVIKTDRFPGPGETIKGYGFFEIPGGKGANQAIAASRLGADVKMIGAVGRDAYGKTLLSNLESFGIDCKAVMKKECNSGLALITVADGENQIVLSEGANHAFTPEDVSNQTELFKWADIVVFQMEIPQEIILAAAKSAKENGAKVLLNCAPICPILPEIISLTDILVPNQHEAATIVGYMLDTPQKQEQAVNDLMKKGIGQVIITLGSEGCIFNNDKEIQRCDAYKVKAVDTTAAGDCFIGAFCARYADGASVTEAVSFATAASAISVGRFGASSSIPEEKEVYEFIKGE